MVGWNYQGDSLEDMELELDLKGYVVNGNVLEQWLQYFIRLPWL